jgi:hypothetical protein
MPYHTQVNIYNPVLKTYVEVDAGIADLLVLLWDAGISTSFSCEDNEPGIMWIEFISSHDAEQFITLAVPQNRGSIYDQAMGKADTQKWQYTTRLLDFSKWQNLGSRHPSTDKPEFHIPISIRFSASIYDQLLINVRKGLADRDATKISYQADLPFSS